MLAHQALPLFNRKQVPGASLPERVNKDVALTAWPQLGPRLGLRLVFAIDDVLRALRHRQVAIWRFKVAAQRGAQQLGTHLVQVVHRVADGPQHQVAVAPQTHRGVAQGQHPARLVPALHYLSKLLLVLCLFRRRQTPPLGHHLIKSEPDNLPLDRWLATLGKLLSRVSPRHHPCCRLRRCYCVCH